MNILKRLTNVFCDALLRVRSNNRVVLFCFFVLFVPIQGYAENMTLQAAIQKALEKNPQLQVYRFRDLELQGLAMTQGLAPGLAIETEFENFAGSGDFDGTDNMEFTLALSSVIELGNKRQLRSSVVAVQRDLAESERQIQSLDLMGSVTRRFVQVISAQQRLELAIEARQIAKDILKSVEERNRVGATSRAEFLRAKAALSQAAMAVVSEQQQLAYKRTNLSVLWGEQNPNFLRVSGNLFDLGELGDFENLYNRAIQNPFIQSFANEERLRDTELRLATAQANGDIDWSVGARRIKETDDTALVASFSMPLFSGKRNSGLKKSALAAKSQVALQREMALLNLHSRLFEAYKSRSQVIETFTNLQTDVIPLLKEALEETRKGYKRGRFSYQELIAARQELLSAQYSLINKAEQALIYRAEIEQLTAETL